MDKYDKRKILAAVLFLFLLIGFFTINSITGKSITDYIFNKNSKMDKVDGQLLNSIEKGNEHRVIIKKKIYSNNIERKGLSLTGLAVEQESNEYISAKIGLDELNYLVKMEEVESIQIDTQYSVLTNEIVEITKIDDVKKETGLTGKGRSICILDTGFSPEAVKGIINEVVGYNFIQNNGDHTDLLGHGTEVTYPITAIAPEAKLFIAKVVDENGIGYASDILKALEWCEGNNVDIISMSIGAGNSNGYCDTDIVAQKVNDLSSKGIITIAATGNNKNRMGIKSPACASTSLAVASSTKESQLALFSNYDSNTLLVAPGENVKTVNNNGEEIIVDGTSMSVPFVTASTALILEKEKKSVQELKDLFVHTGNIIKFNEREFSQLNLENAVTGNVINNLEESGLIGIFKEGDYELLALPKVNSVTVTTSYDKTVTFGGYDSDGDTMTNVTDWRIDGESFAYINMPFNTKVQDVERESVLDYTTYQNHGRLGLENGGESFMPTWITNGKVGGAYSFDGVNDGIAIGHLNYNNLTQFNDNNFTISFWYYMNYTGDGNYKGVIGGRFAGSSNVAWSIFFDDDAYGSGGKCTPRFQTDYTYLATPTDDGFPCDEWAHLVVTKEYPGNTKIYFNGVLNSTGSAIASSKQTDWLEFGKTQWYWPGYLDELLVFDYAISAGQIQEIYNYGLAGKSFDKIAGEEINVGETWEACVTPSDGVNDGERVCSSGAATNEENPVVTLTRPSNGGSGPIPLNLRAENYDDNEVINSSLYTNESGTWELRETRWGGEIYARHPGLVALYHFNEESVVGENSTYLMDFSGYNNHGSCSSPDCPVFITEGKSQGTYNYSNNEYWEVPSSGSLNVGQKISVSFWMNPNTMGSDDMVLSHGVSSENGWYIYSLADGDGDGKVQTQMVLCQSGSCNSETDYGDVVEKGNWTHIVYTVDQDESNIYRNGVKTGGSSITDWQSTINYPLRIGGYSSGTSYRYDGSLDEVAIFNRILTAEEIEDIYDNSKKNYDTIKQDYPVAFYPRDITGGETIKWNVYTMDSDGGSWAATNFTALGYQLPGTELTGCGTLAGDNTQYYLTSDFYSTGHCIRINDNNITVDCNNHVISGDGDIADYGIWTSSASNTTIKNCIVNNFGEAIHLAWGEDDTKIYNSNLTGTIYGISGSASNGDYTGTIIDKVHAYTTTNGGGTDTYPFLVKGENVKITNSYYEGAELGLTITDKSYYENITGISPGYVMYSYSESDSIFKNINLTQTGNSIALFIHVDSLNHTFEGLNIYHQGTSSGRGVGLSGSNGTKIDCKGGTIENINGSTSSAITSNMAGDITVQNCNMKGFAYGLYLDDNSPRAIVENVTIQTWGGTSPFHPALGLKNVDNSNITNVIAESLGNGYGVYIASGSDHVYLVNVTGISDSYNGMRFSAMDNSYINDSHFESGSYYAFYSDGIDDSFFIRNTFITRNKNQELVYLNTGAQRNIFYWNNFTETSDYYVRDVDTSNLFNYTVDGKGEGNIWYNVWDETINVTGGVASGYAGGWFAADSGPDYPYNRVNSDYKFTDSSTIDYAPLYYLGIYLNTMIGDATSWIWGSPYEEVGNIMSGSPTSWTWRAYESGSGRQIPNGTATSWEWIDE